MPYISCPDGHTYSRYDNSTYVNWCKCQEDSIRLAQQQSCAKDPACRAEREHAKQVVDWSIGISLTLAIGIFIYLYISVKKNL